MNDAEIKGIVLLKDGFTAQGEVDLTRATIGSNLECTGGHFIGLGDQSALSINRSDIKGSVFMNTRFSSQGEVDLVGATIGFNLDCGGGLFIGTEKSVALNAKGAKIQGTVFLDRDLETKGNFSADGGIVLASAAIGGDLDFDGCRLTSKWERLALDAQSVKIDGSVSCSNKTTVSGGVRFSFATITRDFQWTPSKLDKHAPLDLQHGRVGSILMKIDGSQSEGDICIDGFIYDHIDDLYSVNSSHPLHWIGLQTQDRFFPQPYEQLSLLLRKMGFQEDAVKVIIAKNEAAGNFAIAEASHAVTRDIRMGHYLKGAGDLLGELWDVCWYWIFGKFIGYGYTPWHALYASLIIIVVGYFVFKFGYKTGIVIPKDDDVSWRRLFETYPKFNAAIYSLETFVPLVSLSISDYWIPNARGGPSLRFYKFGVIKVGSLLRSYFWFHIIAGWVLTTLWVGGFTGLIKS